jgi:tRNA(fMet)-specific endonuclease VapC
MVERLSFDTTFLIDLQKEKRGGAGGRAHEFLREHSGAAGSISAIALGEFIEGFPDPADPRLRRLIESIHISTSTGR